MKQLYLLITILFATTLNAQQLRNYTTYTVDNGLAQNTVWDAFQDHKGFMWFGTADGVNRFDGYKMHYYTRVEKDTNTINGTTSFNFFEDKRKKLWVVHDRGVDVYNRVLNQFIRVRQDQSGAAIVGQSNDSIIWIVFRNKFIESYNINTLKRVIKVPIDLSWNLSFGSTLSTVFIRNKFYIGDIGDIIIEFDPKSLSVKYYQTKGAKGFCLHQLSDSTFCRFFINFASLFTVENGNLKVKKIEYPRTSFFYFSGGTIYNNELYATGSEGLFIFDRQTLKFLRHEKHFSSSYKSTFNYIQNARIDQSNNLYLCSNGGGIFVYSPYRNKFKLYSNNNSQKSLVKAIIKTPNDKILTGVYAEGLTEFNTDGSFSLINPSPSQNMVETVNGFYPKGKNELWMTYKNKISVYNTNKRKVTCFDIEQDTSIGFPYPIFDSVNGNLVINGSTGVYSALIDVASRKIIYRFNTNLISCYKQMNDSSILIGTIEGLFLFNTKSLKISKLAISKFIKSILILNDNQIFIGTINGLYIIDSRFRIKEYYNSTNGLVNNFIYGILSDKAGRVWFSHNRGISVFNPLTKTFKHYGVKDGLQSNEFNTGAYYKDENGLLYFGGVNGINVIDPNNIVENRNPPQIAINEILLGDMPYKTDTAYNEITALNFSYLDNTISFDFSALEFSQPENNTYKYMLEGYDNGWIESGTKHFARYANLPPGNYIFKILAANGDGYWNSQPRELMINISPPYWKTTWFYVLMVLVGLLLLIVIVYVFIKRQRQKLERELLVQHKVEQERLRISRDLHDNVGAQLSYLITNVEWMLEHPDQLSEAEEKQRLSALSEAGRNAILTLRQTIWAISHTTLSVDDFSDRFKQYVLKILEFNKDIQVNFTEEFEGLNNLSPAVALNLFRICQEALSNALKHAKASKLSIDFSSNDNYLFKFTIEDNGIGFDWKNGEKKGHYGLLNMKDRAKEMGATLDVKSEIGFGTTLIITLK